MAETGMDSPYEFTKPLVQIWTQKLSRARGPEGKGPFQEVADACVGFFSRQCGFMWEDSFRQKHIGQIPLPKFKVTINKAFELVQVFGPYLFWRNPTRKMRRREKKGLDPNLFSNPRLQQAAFGQIMPGLEQQVAQFMAQSYEQETAVETATHDARNSVMGTYLNYSSQEQPGGGLKEQGILAVTEALVKGRGCLWPKTYTPEGSSRRLTGLYWHTVDDLFIDPDAKSPLLTDAKWIALRHVTPHWELERKFGLKKNALRGKGTIESNESQAARTDVVADADRANGATNDLVVWYEIWSKTGTGARLEGIDLPIQNYLDEKVVGDYAYLCVSPSCEYLLNAPSHKFKELSDPNNGSIKDMFHWRCADYGDKFPAYGDGRWPVALLDFNPNPARPWPIAPLAPAMGEMIALNILTASFLEQAYEGRKQVLAYPASAKKAVEDALNNARNPALVEINESAHRSIADMIQFLKRPEMNKDIITAIQYVGELFDKRSGLTELLYAMNVGGVQSRSAKDIAVKEEKAGIRPQKMADDVAAFMTVASDLEKLLAAWHVKGRDLDPLLTATEQLVWDTLITEEAPEVLMREMRAMVSAEDLRRPSHEKDVQNHIQMAGYALPVFQQYAQDTGDSGPVNWFLQSFGEAAEMKTEKWQLGPWQPQQDPEQAEMARQQAELEAAKLAADTEKSRMEAQNKQIDAIAKITESQNALAEKQMEFMFRDAENDQTLRHDEETHDQDQRQKAEEHELEMALRSREGNLKLLQQRKEGDQKIRLMRLQKALSKPGANGSA